jgi:hypothetical protein
MNAMVVLDPYLQIAQVSDFLDHICEGDNPETLMLDIVIELQKATAGAELRSLADKNPCLMLNMSHLDADSIFVTAKVTQRVLVLLRTQEFIRRIEFGQILVPQRTEMNRSVHHGNFPVLQQRETVRVRRSKVLAACIDHGCPFAHTEFMHDGKTRLVTLWDQDTNPEFVSLTGGAPSGFTYGKEIAQSELQSVIEGARSQDGSINETDCYRVCGYEAMEGELTHGSHVLGRFVGKSYASKKDISNDQSADAASQADIAFIQLPRDAAKCPSSSAIHRCILDGLRYLRAYCTRFGYERCVVLCDYGSYLGPHDGSSLFERALDAFLAESTPDGAIKVEIVFPSGNCYEDKLHALLNLRADQINAVEWCLPTDNEAATYAELWVSANDAQCVKSVDISTVSGDFTLTLDSLVSESLHGAFGWLTVQFQKQFDGQYVFTLRAAPTLVANNNNASAPTGKIKITFGVIQNCVEPVHGYICWGGEVIGFPRRMRQAWWSIPQASKDRSIISSSGTLMGSACGGSEAIYVIGGYVQSRNPARRERSGYSSVGPSRALRSGPNFVAEADESATVKGIPGPGTRSAIFRNMWGTSVAAPQGARALLNGTLTTNITEPANYQTATDSLSLGKGFLE